MNRGETDPGNAPGLVGVSATTRRAAIMRRVLSAWLDRYVITIFTLDEDLKCFVLVTGLPARQMVRLGRGGPWAGGAGREDTPGAGRGAGRAHLGWMPDHQDPGFDCATAQAPLDYANPAGSQINLYVIRHHATDQANRIGTLFFNPGGPGGPGSTDLPGWLHFFPSAVQARFDIVSWDPRGIGLSTAVLCFETQNQEDRFFTGIPESFPVSGAEQSAWISRYAAYAEKCLKQDGALLAHVSTADSARDLDMLRQAVGSPLMNYLGVWYGTFLGAVYANLFPQNVGGLVLDGNVRSGRLYQRHQLQPHPQHVPAPGQRYRGGTNAEFLPGSLRPGGPRRAARSPIPAPRPRAANSLRYCDGETHARGHRRRHARLCHDAGYDQRLPVHRPGGARFLRLAARGNDVPDAVGGLAKWQGRAAGGSRDCSGVPSGATPGEETLHQRPAGFYDRVPGGPERTARRRLPAAGNFRVVRSGPLGPVQSWADEACASWKAAARSLITDRGNHPTAHPILVIGNTGDPATPYEGSVAMANELASARLLTVNGYGHTTLLNASRCANRFEAAALINGRLPPVGTVCQQDNQPFQ